METTTKSTRKTFAFNTVWYEIIKECSAQVQGEVFAAVMEYALYGKMPETICNEANVIFQFIKIEVDRREKRRQQYHAAKALNKSLESLGSLGSLETITPPQEKPLTRQQRRWLERQKKKLEKRHKVAS